MYDAVVGPELCEDSIVGVDRDTGDDGDVLEAGRTACRLEMIDEVEYLGVDVSACAGFRRLGVDDIYGTRTKSVMTVGLLVVGKGDVLVFGRFFFFASGAWECHEVGSCF